MRVPIWLSDWASNNERLDLVVQGIESEAMRCTRNIAQNRLPEIAVNSPSCFCKKYDFMRQPIQVKRYGKAVVMMEIPSGTFILLHWSIFWLTQQL